MKQQTVAPDLYPPRAPIGNPADWTDPLYAPHEFNAGILLRASRPVWADAPEVDRDVVGARLCYTDGCTGEETTIATKCSFDERNNRPRNPKGKTGLCGRGLLGRWGANHAADVIVTRDGPQDTTQVLLVTKHIGDAESSLAFPAGMVEPGADVPATLRAELTQEAVSDDSTVDRLFNECRVGVVYRGHVDDARNTDNAWMETTVVHFHATPEIGKELKLDVKDKEEIKGVAWYDIDQPTAMYASHLDWLNLVRATHACREPKRRRTS